MDHLQAELRLNSVREAALRSCKRQRVAGLPVGEMGQTIAVAMHAQHPFQRCIVRLQISGSDRPRDHAITTLNPGEVLIRKPQGDPAPGEAAPPHLQTARPQERSIRGVGVGMQQLVGIEPWIGFPVPRMLGLTAVASATEPGQAAQKIGGL